MPITTMWLSRSSGASSSCSRSICSTISPVVRLRARPSRPLAQNTQPMPQPTCVLMQIVRRVSSREQHALDLPAVGEREQQLFGAVVGLRVPGDRGRPEREIARQFVAQRLRQIGHLAKLARPLREQPLPHLADAVRTLTALLQPRRQLFIDRIQQVRHGCHSKVDLPQRHREHEKTDLY